MKVITPALFTLGLLGAPFVGARPNVLVIVADDLGYADIGVHGGRDVPTPHIDTLARSGIRCTNGYVSAPYCGPSRAGLFTGRYQTRFGAEFNARVGDGTRLGLPLAERTIADHLRAAGYATGLVGKWHLGDAANSPESQGFDLNIGGTSTLSRNNRYFRIFAVTNIAG